MMQSNITISKDLDAVAKSLLVNYKLLSSTNLNGKMSLICFLFKFSKQFQNEDYYLSAFNLLEEILTEEFSDLKKYEKNLPLKFVDIVWWLLKFKKEEIFEFDEDIDNLLEAIDSTVIIEVGRLSRTEFRTEFMRDLVFIGFYLNERIDHIKQNVIYFLKIKELTLITFFEISLHIDSISKTNEKLILQIKILLKNIANTPYLKHFSEDIFKHLNDIQLFDLRESLNKKTTLLLKGFNFKDSLDLFMALEKPSSVLQNTNKSNLKIRIQKIQKQLCETESNNKEILILELIVLGVFFLYDINEK
ncbi:hypothetical protein Q4Q35_08250 [Flavivirga aquimarina]|uniref:Uncharacterized protein n=1 Tax=Flavivirga aquimarina TaxID=2027862 RepID=A0ABT8W9M5_9FLAO|nr:hypothetical protein [Flavivirga aquimarina]MDO5969796.1 hypothetical protein [Flavivirga aquimarina]